MKVLSRLLIFILICIGVFIKSSEIVCDDSGCESVRTYAGFLDNLYLVIIGVAIWFVAEWYFRKKQKISD